MFKIIQKPLFRAPCNHCGECCKAGQCEVSEMIFGAHDGQCEALEVEGDGRFSCGLVKRPIHYIRPDWGNEPFPQFSELMTQCLGIGQGCGMED